jgi:gliding motility-associated-like protein
LQDTAFHYKDKTRVYDFKRRLLFTCVFIVCCCINSFAQDCPPNIDFEKGDFSGWNCYTGFVASVNNQNIISLSLSGPQYDRHTMYTASPTGLPMLDFYGGFPVNCPNGSGHSIRLGNSRGGGEAEGVSYEFTIPANKDVYSLIYHYAVVFQDPDHLESQQPRMEIEITDVTDDEVIQCSSFTFHPYGSVLPGFFLSPNPGGETPVWCKDWSAVSINLDNKAGKTIRLFFKTADCTFKRHFGYAYIDVNSECSSEFVGATYCHDDTAVTVVAPYGYQSYKWFNHSFSSVLGTSQTLRLQPPPLAGTTIAVELIPFDGYGCLDTLYARLVDTLTVRAIAGPDMLSCNLEAVQLGIPPKQGIVYHWSPSVGLTNPEVSNPLASPPTTTAYVLTSNSSGGGCRISDTVIVKASIVDNTLQLIGKQAYCITSGDSAILEVKPTSNIQWFKENIPLSGATQTDLRVTQTGTYHALLINNNGCSLTTLQKTVTIDVPRPGITYPIKYAVINKPLTLKAREFGDTVLWNPGTRLDKPKSYNPVFTGATDQLYRVDITTFSGCLTQDTQFVKIVERVEVYVPTAFTPNHDGHNDYLRPLARGLKETHYFRIFNRLGQLLYEMKGDEQPGWDGTIHGNPQTTQTVVWVVEGIGVDNLVYKKTGTTILIR